MKTKLSAEAREFFRQAGREGIRKRNRKYSKEQRTAWARKAIEARLANRKDRYVIIPGKDKWIPTSGLIIYLRRIAKKRKLFYKWPTIAVISENMLLLNCSPANRPNLIAAKPKARWMFRETQELIKEC